MRARRTRVLLVVLSVLLVTIPHPARAEKEGRIVAVDPHRTGDLVVCRLTTDGLLGAKLLQSMRSGMVSQIDLDLALLNTEDEPIGGNRLSMRLAFDLWEEIFTVSFDGRHQRFDDLAGLMDYLRELDSVPVAQLDLLETGRRYSIRVGVQLHPIAPSQRDEMEAAIAGQQRRRREGQDEQETSVNMGRLIRFFYKNDERAEHRAQSRWFQRKELSDAQD